MSSPSSKKKAGDGHYPGIPPNVLLVNPSPPAAPPVAEPTSETNPQPLPENPEEWSPAQVMKYLQDKQNEYYLTNFHIKKFEEQEVAGADFIELTKNDLREAPYNLTDGTARRIERLINALKGAQAKGLAGTEQDDIQRKCIPDDLWSDGTLKRKIDSIAEDVKAIREVKKEISFSTVSNTQYQDVMTYLELEEPRPVEFEVPPMNKKLEEFVWGPEKEDAQMNRCLTWLESIITLPAKTEMHSVSAKKDFLNYSFGGANNSAYLLKGTTDIIIVPTRYVENLSARAGVRIAIELKKEVSEANRRQAVMEFIAISAFSHFPATVVLTDLRQHWQFMWATQSGIQQVRLDLNRGMTLMQNILDEQGSGPYRDMCRFKDYLAGVRGTKVAQVEGPHTMDQVLSRERVELYDLVPKPDSGNMEDFFGEMSEEEIRQYKYGHAMKALTSSALWQTWQSMYA